MPMIDNARFNPSRGRKPRRPEHRWFVSHKPWELQVCMLAPVLPNERLRGFTWESRAVTDPLASSLVGWWLEYWWFYVPMSLLPQYDDLVSSIESGDLNTALTAGSADASTYYAGRGVDWAKACRDVVVREWFRTEDEQAAAPAPYIRTSPNRPAIRTSMDGLHHSLRMGANYPGGDGGSLGTTQRSQEELLRTYEYLRTQGLAQMDYEDWLRTYGVTNPEQFRRKRPVMLRYQRNWQYPSNTVNQSTGVPVSACSWVTRGRGDKHRTFTEPGFIIGVTASRPKVYYSGQDACGAAAMDRVRYWHPAVLRDDPLNSYRDDSATSSPVYDGVLAAAHWVDMRDLLIRGDQFLAGSGQSNQIALPTAAGEAQYATEAMADALFTNPGSAGLLFIRQDGVARCNIVSAVEDAVDATAQT